MKNVAVAIPLFNGNPNYFRGALQSIVDQKYESLTVFVGIDREDEWADKNNLNNFYSVISDMRNYLRIVVINEKTGWLSDILNALLYHMQPGKFDYISKLDYDDKFLPGKIEKQIKFMQDNNLDFSSTRGQIIDENDKITIEKWDYGFSENPGEYLFNNGNCLIHSSIMFSGKLLEKRHLFYNPIYNKSCEDYELYLRLLTMGYKMGILPEVLMQYRVHGGQVSHTSQMKASFAKMVEPTRKYYQAIR